MGFNVTALAQKARTQTLIVDSDLDMGQYDIIATDVKGDTAEFSEFVGGVGNFTSGLFSSGVDVSGILHAEGNTQVDGNIILEGSINNVNIADDGEITTTKGVNGADFNGAKITSTKFNGATIDSSGNVTGAKGSFNGAVTAKTLYGLHGYKISFMSGAGYAQYPSIVSASLTQTYDLHAMEHINLSNTAGSRNITYKGFRWGDYPITSIDNNSNVTWSLVPSASSVSCIYNGSTITRDSPLTISKNIVDDILINGLPCTVSTTSGTNINIVMCIRMKSTTDIDAYVHN